jgi:uncharacterized protein (UPF0212 family)
MPPTFINAHTCLYGECLKYPMAEFDDINEGVETCPECGEELDEESSLCLKCNLGLGEPLTATGEEEDNGI